MALEATGQPLMPESEGKGVAWREGLVLLGVLAVARVSMAISLGAFLGGKELADDGRFQVAFIEEPLRMFSASGSSVPPFPPLLPVLLSVFGRPLRHVLSDFYMLRGVFIAYELIAFTLLWVLLHSTVPAPRSRRILGLAYVVCPMAWMTSTVMKQEETVSMMFLALTMLLVVRGRTNWAILVCALGAVAAKIYFLVPLVGLLFVYPMKPWKATVRRFLLGGVPVVLTYGIAVMRSDVYGPIVGGFAPSARCSVNFWFLVPYYTGIADVVAKWISTPMALIFSLVPLVVARWRSRDGRSIDRMTLCTAMMMWTFVSFYHINPEYFAIILPALLVLFKLRWSIVINVGVLSLAWAVNFFYGVGSAMRRGPRAGKAKFVQIYESMTTIDPDVLANFVDIIFSVACVIIAVVLTLRLARGQCSATANDQALKAAVQGAG